MNLENSFYLGRNVSRVACDRVCSVYRLHADTGEGLMTVYEVFPGVNLLFSDFQIEHCMSYFKTQVPVFCIDHCQEGRLEWEVRGNGCLYMEAGDLQLNARAQHEGRYQFPLHAYRGLTVSICTEKASESLRNILDGFAVDFNALRAKFCQDKQPFIIRAGRRIEHIFSELYAVPDEIKIPFFKVKVMEMLLLLSAWEFPSKVEERSYFDRLQVKKIKAIMKLMTRNPEHHYTLEALSDRFQMPVTSMTKCFKGVFGMSIHAYMKQYRMKAAAVKLHKTKDSVTSIALQSGYGNASKFSAAFKSIMGTTPSDYRKSVVQME
ncbi:AraC family transcriptional regulator [Sporolactobacillus shoreicorticis]|uniref:Helix-turn-helix domain-containing protein n=1 Tax=Sporolactobacillus shoreicorticis TaxID=1923877 RepID=A0ABW5S2B1_9BACL|nr:AraC family transcriptional regulator [Sporolactobacillus shoreicorticis]MCO7126467.1 AraC family transcriptional regulator [Sporolactobacillus shoreicorticis]